MTVELILALVAFAFVGSVTPGPNNLMLMTSGLNFGWFRTLPHMFGVGIGFLVMVVLVGLGLTRLFELFPLSYVILKTLSALYLTYLAWKIYNMAPTPKAAEGQPEASSKPMTFLQAAMFQWVNPKAWVMALTAISAYTVSTSAMTSVLIVAAVFALVMLPSISMWVLLGRQMQRFLSDEKKLRWFNRIAALLLMLALYPIVMG